MADQLAIAIHNANLHQQNKRLLARAERRARLLEAAAKVSRDVTSILDMDTLLKRTVDVIATPMASTMPASFSWTRPASGLCSGQAVARPAPR
jgi:hypothetical protein